MKKVILPIIVGAVLLVSACKKNTTTATPPHGTFVFKGQTYTPPSDTIVAGANTFIVYTGDRHTSGSALSFTFAYFAPASGGYNIAPFSGDTLASVVTVQLSTISGGNTTTYVSNTTGYAVLATAGINFPTTGSAMLYNTANASDSATVSFTSCY